MFEYQTLFDARGDLYSRANSLYPEARDEEARRMLDHLPSGVTDWLDVSTGGGYLTERARAHGRAPARFSCDASIFFLRTGPSRRKTCVCRAEELAFADGAFGAAASLAALHHSEGPDAVVRELLRVTRPGGRAALGDVAAGSRASQFLNGFVDRHTAAGHRGRFYGPDQMARFFARAGGTAIRVEPAEVSWNFASRQDALSYCRDLFGLVADDTDEDLSSGLAALGARHSRGRYRIPWTMLYSSAQRR